MTINWPLLMVIFCFSIPGICIAIPRMDLFLLNDSNEIMQLKFSRLAMLVCFSLSFIMSFIGVVLSARTGLNAPVLEGILSGQRGLDSLVSILGPTFVFTLLGLIFFYWFYYGIVKGRVDIKSFEIMEQMRAAIGLDGCVFYGGVVDEIIARWGLMNAVVFFAMLMTGQATNVVIVLSIFFSGFIFAISQVPTYLAAGCTPSRTVVYSIVFLNLFKSMIFGFLFWRYGLMSAILAHMLFHLLWSFKTS